MKLESNVNLADLTSLAVGGKARNYCLVNSTDELVSVLHELSDSEFTLLGYGCNSLISDSGISGLVINIKGGNIIFEDDVVIADAGVWWDELVRQSIDKGLWGIELTSEIPGSVGAAAFINITAYGQSIGGRTEWIEVWDKSTKQVAKLTKEQLSWDYKKSIFQENNDYVILRVALKLSTAVTDELTYQKALDVATELNLNPNDINDRRSIIIEARKRAGSIWHENDEFTERTAGSFFRNPIVSSETADIVMNFDESNLTKEQIQNMNKVHGGDKKRVSAAHVMLAAGFKRGQSWGKIKLNDKNVLKLETLDGATASDVYRVMNEIQRVCERKLGITLEPEVQLLGDF